MKKSVTLTFTAEKVNSVRYDARHIDSLLTTIYIRKAELPRPFPENIVVTVEA